MAAIDDFNQIKDVLEALDTLKPARFGYTQGVLDATGAAEITSLDGIYVIDDASQINSIPDASQVVMDDLIISTGLRSQAATISRMMVNHFFGRLSLNLIKLTEKVKALADTHLVNRYIAASGKLIEYLSVTYTSTKITIVQHLSSLSANAPDTSESNIDINAAVSGGNAGLLTGVDKAFLDAVVAEAVRIIGAQTIAGVKTFSSIPVLPASDPTTDNQATRRQYITALDAQNVKITGDQVINGNKEIPNVLKDYKLNPRAKFNVALVYGATQYPYAGLSPYLPNVGDIIGLAGFGNAMFFIYKAERMSSTMIRIYGIAADTMTSGSFDLTSTTQHFFWASI